MDNFLSGLARGIDSGRQYTLQQQQMQVQQQRNASEEQLQQLRIAQGKQDQARQQARAKIAPQVDQMVAQGNWTGAAQLLAGVDPSASMQLAQRSAQFQQGQRAQRQEQLAGSALMSLAKGGDPNAPLNAGQKAAVNNLGISANTIGELASLDPKAPETLIGMMGKKAQLDATSTYRKAQLDETSAYRKAQLDSTSTYRNERLAHDRTMEHKGEADLPDLHDMTPGNLLKITTEVNKGATPAERVSVGEAKAVMSLVKPEDRYLFLGVGAIAKATNAVSVSRAFMRVATTVGEGADAGVLSTVFRTWDKAWSVNHSISVQDMQTVMRRKGMSFTAKDQLAAKEAYDLIYQVARDQAQGGRVTTQALRMAAETFGLTAMSPSSIEQVFPALAKEYLTDASRKLGAEDNIFNVHEVNQKGSRGPGSDGAIHLPGGVTVTKVGG